MQHAGVTGAAGCPTLPLFRNAPHFVVTSVGTPQAIAAARCALACAFFGSVRMPSRWILRRCAPGCFCADGCEDFVRTGTRPPRAGAICVPRGRGPLIFPRSTARLQDTHSLLLTMRVLLLLALAASVATAAAACVQVGGTGGSAKITAGQTFYAGAWCARGQGRARV